MASISQLAAGRGVDLLVFPVAALTGPVVVDYSAQEPFLSDLVETLSGLALDVSCDCLVPVVVLEGDVPTIQAVLLRDGVASPLGSGPQGWSDFPAGVSGSKPHAEGLTSLEASGSRVGLAFSYEDLDAWCDEPHGSDVLCYLASYGYAVDDPSSALGGALHEGRFVDDASESGAWLVGVGSLGGYGTQVFSGSSFVLSPDGRLAASCAAFEEGLLVAEVGAGAVLGAEEELAFEVYDERYHLWQSLVLGIRDYLHKLGFSDAVLALDGSLPSMLLSVLATDALGPTHVHALLCAEADSPRLADASRLARALRVDVHTALELAPSGTLSRADLIDANLRALARGVDGMVLSSADKTGLALECERWCPSAGWLAPLGDVYRIDVLDVARLRNTISSIIPGLALVPDDVPDVGISVPEWNLEPTLERMDASLATHVEGARGLAQVEAAVGDEQLARAVLARFHDLDAARTLRPPCLMMSTRTLSDARMPLGFAWQDQGREVDLPRGFDPKERPLRPLRATHDKASSGASASDGSSAPEEYQDMIREALELLRDLSVGSAPDWLGPFSEN